MKVIADIIQKTDVAVIINDLKTNLRCVNNWLADVQALIDMLDIQTFTQEKPDTSTNRGPFLLFKQNLNQLRGNFRNLVWRSKEVATMGAAHAKMYREQLHPLIMKRSTPLEVKEKRITQFISTLHSAVQEAKDMTDAFWQFSTQVEALGKQIPDLLKHLREIGKGKGQTKTMTQGINGLQQKFNDDHVWNAGRKLAGGVVVALLGGAGIQAGLGPFLGPLCVIALIGGVVSMCIGAYQLWSGRLEPTAVVKSASDDLGKLWASVRTNEQMLHVNMNADKTPDEWSISFWESSTLPTYKKLEDILWAYANHSLTDS